MSDQSQKTEKPTPRRLSKAREEGRYPVSREALSTATFTVAAFLVIRFLPAWPEEFASMLRFSVGRAFSTELSVRTLVQLWQAALLKCLFPLLAGGALVLLTGVGIQLGMTGFGFAGSRIKLDFNRLNPIPKLRDMPMQNLTQALQGLVALGVFGALIYMEVGTWIPIILRLPLQPLRGAISSIGDLIVSLVYKAVFIFLLFGAFDYIRQRMRYMKELKMTKQEIKEEFKESEGSPEVKHKIRRLQRDAARKRMMEQVPKASAIIVNPTHYSVAIHYDPQGMAAPRVVAKGKNYLARRIREIAIANEIPIIENPPLARSLYKAVDVGHEIPASLYRAVAEVLAYIYRLMHGRRG